MVHSSLGLLPAPALSPPASAQDLQRAFLTFQLSSQLSLHTSTVLYKLRVLQC